MSQDNSSDLNDIRHSCAHLLAAAVMELYPDAKRTIGPAIDNGFYYDFDFNKPISEADLPKIEAKMAEIIKDWDHFEHREITADEAKEMFADNPYKLELITEIVEKGEPITIYKSGNFEDLCRGGHSENPKEDIGAFKLLSIAGAYWRGSEKNKMLTRIYGTCFKTQKELDKYLEMLEEAKKRDHKKLGKELGLFTFSDLVGKGLPLFTAKGAAIRREIERFAEDEEIKRGYQHVITPDIASLELYKRSGHYPYYQDSMYAPIEIEGEQYMLRPMSCPHHFALYLDQPHSYRELPIRYAEIVKLYRFEQSGELSGLQRVRAFSLADAHIIARVDQAESEINQVLDLIEYAASKFHLQPGVDYHYRLSLGDRNDEGKYFKDDAAWEKAEDTLRKVLVSRDAHFVEAKKEAAFYGPKIDVQMKNVNGKEDTAFTVQYDFVMPKRFNLTYINESGVEEQPIVIHRSSVGATERVMAFLIEHFGGAFPTWLSPVQIMIVPISEKHNEYAQNVLEQLMDAKIRAEVDTRAETMQSKIRSAQMQKIPYMLVVGDREVEAGTVAVRTRAGENQGVVSIAEFIEKVSKEVADKA